MHIEVHERLDAISSHDWNALVKDNNPFLRHEFLHGLEVSNCVCADTGWQPQHITIYTDDRNTLLAAMPCYIKSHSFGEYIFDWAWVNAYHRHGIEYYPKLSNAVPFTPATGPRLLLADNLHHHKLNSNDVSAALIQRAITLTHEKQLSSFHSLFNTQEQASILQREGLLKRHSTQFHWRNRGYQSFDHFLSGMSSKKRKNIKRERRRVLETGIEYRWLSSNELTLEAAHRMHDFYSRTIRYYGAQSYLNKPFFEHLVEHFGEQTLFLFAEFGNEIIAGGLYFKSNNTLYGRYWGAMNNFHSVHFETCYYQAIEWCIKHGFESFEAGAQGEHKLARGLEPTTTYSTHWIAHPEFRDAISEFLTSEEEHIHHYKNAMQLHSPFKQVDNEVEL